jgi:hypothetical protein
VSLLREIQEQRELVAGSARFLQMTLALKCQGETVLMAGGVWDNLLRRFQDRMEPEWVHELEIAPSQRAFVEWFDTWLLAFREGRERVESLAFLEGDRRGGKSWAGNICQQALLIDCPRVGKRTTIGWAISRTHSQRHELWDEIRACIPSEWYRARGSPDFQLTYLHGSVWRSLSAERPEDLKQGKVDAVLVNEAQKISPQAVAHATRGTADAGGLIMLTANPPSKDNSRGEWLVDLYEAIRESKRKGEELGARTFNFLSKLNPFIDQEARTRAARLAGIIYPESKDADDEGKWTRPGDRAAWEFDRSRHLCPPPQVGLVDVTSQVTYRRDYVRMALVAGADWQKRPAIVGIVYRLFGDPDRPTWWAVDELVLERGHEKPFLEHVRASGYSPDLVQWVGDASGSWQNAEHKADDPCSYAYWEQDGWTILPPRDPIDAKRKPSNPHVDARLAMLNQVLAEGRYLVDPGRCPGLAEALKDAQTERRNGRRVLKNTGPAGRWVHWIDAATYPLWRYEPAPVKPMTLSPDQFRAADRTRKPLI